MAEGGGEAVLVQQSTDVLIVEDDLPLLSALAEALHNEGYNVCIASDGHHALGILRQGFQPQIILLDIRMPRLDGMELLAELRKDPAYRKIPAIGMSGSTFRPEETLGFDAWISKPLNLDRLLAVIGQMERLKAARDAASELTPDPRI